MNSIIIAANIFRRLIREMHAIAFLLIFPILAGLFTVTLVSHYEVSRVGITYNFPKNHTLTRIIENTDKFKLVNIHENDLEDRIKSKDIEMGILIPADFERKLRAGEHLSIKVIGLKETANLIHIRNIVEDYMESVILKNKSSRAQFLINAKNNIPAQRSSLGFLLMFILLFTGTSMELLLEDKKCKTFMRTFCAPVREYDMVLGNILAGLILGTIQILIFLYSTKFLFNFDWKIPIPNVFLILFSFLIASVGISIGLMGFIHDNKIYSIVNVLISLFTSFIGGAFFSSSLMGEWLDKVANFLPQKWAMQAYEKMVDGSALNDVQINFWILVLFGAVFFTFGLRFLKPAEEEL